LISAGDAPDPAVEAILIIAIILQIRQFSDFGIE